MSSRRNSSNPFAAAVGCAVALVMIAIVAVMLATQFSHRKGPVRPAGVRPSLATPAPRAPSVNPIEQMLQPRGSVTPVEGVGVAVLMDVSGSMGQNVADVGGSPTAKIAIARRSVLDVVRKTEAFAREHPDKLIKLCVYEFSSRRNAPSCRTVIPLGVPNLAAAQSAVASMRPDGNTPIGDAIIQAKRDLDATGLTHLHVLVVTDGENNQGYSPGDVVDVISRQEPEHRASVYFIAFDVAAEKFRRVRDAGGLVLSAADANQLGQALDYVLAGKILAEQPAVPASTTP